MLWLAQLTFPFAQFLREFVAEMMPDINDRAIIQDDWL
jgi:hypothetical protein